jgi:hypothetical protein
MEGGFHQGIASQKTDTVRILPEEKTWLLPWLFANHELMHALEKARTIDAKRVINALNHIHFSDGYVYVLLTHTVYQENVLLKSRPGPCIAASLTCSWADNQISSLNLEDYRFSYLLIDDHRSLMMVPAKPIEINHESFRIEIPETSYAVGERQSRRYSGQNVNAELGQSGFQAIGQLVDFSAKGFRLKVKPEGPGSFRWLNQEVDATVHLRHQQTTVYSGPCRFIRQKGDSSEKEIVVLPVEEKIRRFRNKQARNARQRLVPSPRIVFRHPLLDKKVQMEIENISTSGFSVFEDTKERMLMPGLIIPDLAIYFAGVLKINCLAQVIYCQPEGKKGVRCGIAILDMGINAYSRLTHILTNALDPHACISNDVEMDDLWEFFFQAGFIYSKKYGLIQGQRETFKETYKKLYQEHPEIARHFTYQKNGRIYSHVSMVRAYERAWMVHHHAALAMGNRLTGFSVMKQLIYYLNDMCRLPSAHMDYMMLYFRPDNKFPDAVFGGFARELNDPRGCSLDLFGYLPYTRLSLGTKLPESWSLSESSEIDLWEFSRFYRHKSGGLLLDALSIEAKGQGTETLEQVYAQAGLFRNCKLYSLRHRGKMHALLIANKSSLGFNLSELLNGIKVMVTIPEGLPWSVLSVAISQLTSEYQLARVPILFYPMSYVESNGIPCEKSYQLWVLNVQYGNEYMDYMQKKFRITYS